LLALTRRRNQEDEDYDDEPSVYPERQSPYASSPRPSQPGYGQGYPQGGYPQGGYPPIIVVAPPQNQMPNPYGHLLPPGPMHEPPIARDFKIIGGEDDDTFDA
jgi:hypothetical protein